jgi:hypothetical protein
MAVPTSKRGMIKSLKVLSRTTDPQDMNFAGELSYQLGTD